MPGAEDLRRWRQDAGQLGADLRAAALLRIARVLFAYNPAEALACFDAGLEAARAVQERERDLLMGHARVVAAAIAPERVREVEVSHRCKLHFPSDVLVKTMLDHGHLDAAIQFVLNDKEVASEFPFGMIAALTGQTSDQETKVALLRRAVQAWRISLDQEPHTTHSFLWSFGRLWNVLPEAETRAVVQEIVTWARTRAGVNTHARYGGDVQFTSEGESTLFQVLHVLRIMDPSLAESVVALYPQLNAAAQRYPDGLESMQREANARMAAEKARRRERGEQDVCGTGVVVGGSERDIQFVMGLMRARADEQFEKSLQYALDAYAEDTAPEGPNVVSKEFWPSTHYLRSVIYQAGKKTGSAAVALLDRAPDPDLRLLAAIELEAALTGLPEFPGARVESRQPRRTPGIVAATSTIVMPGEMSRTVRTFADRISAARNADGNPAGTIVGHASAATSGTRSIVAESAPVACESGKKRNACGVMNGRLTRRGTRRSKSGSHTGRRLLAEE